MINLLKQLARPLVGRFPSLLHFYRVRRDSKFRDIQPRRTPYGFLLTGNEQMMAGSFEPIETEIIRKLLLNNDIFINIGANIGYYVCHALHNGLQAVAIEPHPANVDYLLKNIKANGFEKNVEVHHVAVSDSKCVVELFGTGTGASLVPGWAGSPTSKGHSVFASTLDDIIGDRFTGKPSLILMDVEGHEDSSLAGASKLLMAEPKPTWIVEIAIDEHREGINPKLLSVFDRFWQTGYTCWTCDKVPRIVTDTEIRSIAETGVNSLSTHNFIFGSADLKHQF